VVVLALVGGCGGNGGDGKGLVGAAAKPPPPPSPYSLTWLGTLNGAVLWAKQVGDGGQVVGYVSSPSVAGFLWNGTAVGLSPLGVGRDRSQAWGLDGSGNLVVGQSYSSTLSGHACVWTGGAGAPPVDLAPPDDPANPGWINSNAVAANYNGQIVGYADGQGPPHSRAVLWQLNGSEWGMTRLAELDGATTSGAGAINANGQIMGNCGVYDVWLDAVLWENSTASPTRLNPAAGQTGSNARDLNNSGQVAGGSGTLAVVWESGSVNATALPVLKGAVAAIATGINDGGLVVGRVQMRAVASPTDFKAVLWKKTNGAWTCTDLNTQIPRDTGVYLAEAVSINNNGWILCGPYGRPDNLLKPNP
jgi:uncharacterized membrane protein